MTFSVEPARPASIQGEAVVLRLRFENKGREEATIELGTDFKEHITLTAVRGEQKLKGTGKRLGGLRAAGTVKVAAGDKVSRQLVLDEFLSLDQAGTYTLDVAVGEEHALKATTTVSILPTAGERCKELWDAYNNEELSSDQRRAALTALCHTRHENALDYQKEMILHAPAGGLEYQQAATRSIILTGTAEGIRFLASEVLAKKPTEKVSTRDVVLHQLRSVGTKHLDETSRKLLAPYETEIAKAPAIGIDD
jgi:hypothetical protein